MSHVELELSTFVNRKKKFTTQPNLPIPKTELDQVSFDKLATHP